MNLVTRGLGVQNNNLTTWGLGNSQTIITPEVHERLGGDDAWLTGPIFAETLEEFIARNEAKIDQAVIDAESIESALSVVVPQVSDQVFESFKRNRQLTLDKERQIARAEIILKGVRRKLRKTVSEKALEQDLMDLMLILATDEDFQ